MSLEVLQRPPCRPGSPKLGVLRRFSAGQNASQRQCAGRCCEATEGTERGTVSAPEPWLKVAELAWLLLCCSGRWDLSPNPAVLNACPVAMVPANTHNLPRQRRKRNNVGGHLLLNARIVASFLCHAFGLLG